MTRYKLTIEYKGSDYYGWQRQNDVPTIQQAIENAIEKFSSQKTRVHSAGRTDAGVHAKAHVAHVDLGEFSKPMDEFAILKAINAHLKPQPISIINVEIVKDDFHARFDAINKLYRYRIINRPSFLTHDFRLAWHIYKPLDVDSMRRGAEYLIGKHDFTTFRDSECQAKSPVKTLDRVDIITSDYDSCGGVEISFEVEGKSFLHHQVRNIVGTLSLVGLGKWSPEDILTALKAKDRTKGGPTAPAEGLYLIRVDFNNP